MRYVQYLQEKKPEGEERHAPIIEWPQPSASNHQCLSSQNHRFCERMQSFLDRIHLFQASPTPELLSVASPAINVVPNTHLMSRRKRNTNLTPTNTHIQNTITVITLLQYHYHPSFLPIISATLKHKPKHMSFSLQIQVVSNRRTSNFAVYLHPP